MISAAILDCICLCMKHHPEAFSGRDGSPFICIGILEKNDPQISQFIQFWTRGPWSEATLPVRTKNPDICIQLEPTHIIKFNVSALPVELLQVNEAPKELVLMLTGTEKAECKLTYT